MDLNDVKKIITYNLGYKKGENILVVTDTKLEQIGKMFFEAGLSLGAETIQIIMAPRRENGQEPPLAVSQAMQNADIILIPTSKSLSHTKARRDATEMGARIASMPGITLPIFDRMTKVDFKKLAERTKKIADILRKTKKVRVTTKLGTNLVMDIEGRHVDEDTGLLLKKGDFGNLPAGEADLSPHEGSTEGIMVIDGSVIEKKVTTPIKVTIEKGFAVKFVGGSHAKELESTLKKVGPLAFNIAELGIGTNDRAILTGNILEDEKIYGTCHIAFGNNMSYGGNVDVPIHQDAIITEPDIFCDDRLIIKKGKLII
ncbi:MAG: aminopeptidase [Nanoarchaeota archaeon]|nr:aminopeptidase [Nanoarchaeota archaeon]